MIGCRVERCSLNTGRVYIESKNIEFQPTQIDFNPTSTTAAATTRARCLDEAKEEKDLVKEEQRGTGRSYETTSKASQSQQSEDLHDEVV